MMSEREVRIAHTEALFRDVNERIAESAERFDAEEADFVCECSEQHCAERVAATLEEYEQVRGHGDHFLLVPGHEDTDVERVVARPRPRLAVVKKVNTVVARTVRRLDPRAQPT
jgi:alkanesulfonate monooxygenase SsuD/methylene tetrahydromethanopterin reductase-like flavin-dependent oxidoreductase (luciferase family)